MEPHRSPHSRGRVTLLPGPYPCRARPRPRHAPSGGCAIRCTGLHRTSSVAGAVSSDVLTRGADALDQLRGGILEQHRLQGEGAALPRREQRAARQGLHRLHHGRLPHQRTEVVHQRSESQRCPLRRQPGQHRVLRGREARDLFLEQLPDIAEDRHVLGQEGREVAAEDGANGLPHHLQRQRIARVARHQLVPRRGVAGKIAASQQRPALVHPEPVQAHRPNGGVVRAQGLLPAGHQQTALVRARAQPP